MKILNKVRNKKIANLQYKQQSNQKTPLRFCKYRNMKKKKKKMERKVVIGARNEGVFSKRCGLVFFAFDCRV